MNEPLWKTNERVLEQWRKEYRNYIVAKGVAYIAVIAISFTLGALIF